MSEINATLLTIWHLGLREAVLIVAIGIAISGIDDLFIDLVFFGRSLWRRWFIYSKHPRANVESMRRADPAPIAIIIPAWEESAVIGAMLGNLLDRLDYPDYRVFVGLYPNDPAGAAAVASIKDARVSAVLCRHPGPTTKADCLNHLWTAVTADEQARGRLFKAVVLHDAEDVVHPQELWIYDALIPKLAMVQLPVMPLPDPQSRWISGHYLDEFAESHAKDLVVREALGAAVPSAGVACAIDRAILGQIANAAGGQPFDAACLTEDYELGHRIKALGGRGAFVRVRSGGERVAVATREHFPASLDAALRQKTRWLVGISLAGWDRLGWPGDLADHYMLLRDRKALVASLLTVCAYILLALIIVDWGLRHTLPMAAMLPPLNTPLMTGLLWFNAGLLIWRLVMRAGFTAYSHGPVEGLRALPRALASNFINAASAWRALQRYRAMLGGTSRLTWDKTDHRFPDHDAIEAGL